MNNLSLIILPFIYRKLPIPGWLANKINKLFRIKVDGLEVPLITRCRSDIKVLIINPRDLIQKQLYFQGYFEYRETKLLEKYIRPGMTYLDVGANIGWHTLVAAKLVGVTGKVISFEPVLSTYTHLDKNIRLNQLRNVRLFRYGLSNTNNSVPIYPVSQDNDGSNSLFSIRKDSTPIEVIETKVGSEILMAVGVNHIDFCKIDVEGAEMNVLEGLDSLLKNKRIKILMIELNEIALERAGRTGKQLVEKLKNYGFNIIDIRSRDNVNEFTPPKETNLLCTYN